MQQDAASSTSCPPKEEISIVGEKRQRPRGPPPKSYPLWNDNKGCYEDDEGNRRPEEKKARRRTPEAQERKAEVERARKKRIREGRHSEQQRLVMPKLEAAASGAGARCVQGESQLQGAPPGVDTQEESTQPKLPCRKFDVTNNLNKLLTQGFRYPIPKRDKKTLHETVLEQISNLEEHGVMSDYQDVQVSGHSIVGVLQLVSTELKSKKPQVSARQTLPPPEHSLGTVCKN